MHRRTHRLLRELQRLRPVALGQAVEALVACLLEQLDALLLRHVVPPTLAALLVVVAPLSGSASTSVVSAALLERLRRLELLAEAPEPVRLLLLLFLALLVGARHEVQVGNPEEISHASYPRWLVPLLLAVVVQQLALLSAVLTGDVVPLLEGLVLPAATAVHRLPPSIRRTRLLALTSRLTLAAADALSHLRPLGRNTS